MIAVDLEEVVHVETKPEEKRVTYYLKGNNKAFVLTGERGGSFMQEFLAYRAPMLTGSGSIIEEGGGAYWEKEGGKKVEQ